MQYFKNKYTFEQNKTCVKIYTVLLFLQIFSLFKDGRFYNSMKLKLFNIQNMFFKQAGKRSIADTTNFFFILHFVIYVRTVKIKVSFQSSPKSTGNTWQSRQMNVCRNQTEDKAKCHEPNQMWFKGPTVQPGRRTHKICQWRG